ncbi:MAG: DNA alkylation repair protein [Bacillota bacterium]|nr:DNA alkylation repair protein [Bacillota bacterium]
MSYNKDNYEDFRNLLFSNKDEKYLSFHRRLVPENDNLIGICVPLMRKIAKEIAHENGADFINIMRHDYYEECMIHGLILGYLKTDFISLVSMINDFLPFIDNWAVCDSFCSGLKAVKTHQSEFLPVISSYLLSSDPWTVRAGLVLLLFHYIDDEHFHTVLAMCDKVRLKHYYVSMAQAWLISAVYVKYRKETLVYLRNCNLDDVTYNRALQKAKESLKTSKDEKIILENLKRKNGFMAK